MGKKIKDLKQMYKSEINYTKKKKEKVNELKFCLKTIWQKLLENKSMKYMLKGKRTRNYICMYNFVITISKKLLYKHVLIKQG